MDNLIGNIIYDHNIEYHFYYLKKRIQGRNSGGLFLVASLEEQEPSLMKYCVRLAIKDNLQRVHIVAKFGEFDVTVSQVIKLLDGIWNRSSKQVTFEPVAIYENEGENE